MNTYIDIRIQMCYNIVGILIDPLINYCFGILLTHEKEPCIYSVCRALFLYCVRYLIFELYAWILNDFDYNINMLVICCAMCIINAAAFVLKW